MSVRVLSLCLLAACAGDPSTTDDTGSEGTTTVLAEVWADNWSSMYVDGTLVMEDSTPITTERSFNAEVFTFDADGPVTIGVVMKDYVETDSGLEYIGQQNQQMGDGGYIAQFSNDATGAYLGGTGSDWKCFVTYTAPLNPSCEGDANPNTTCQYEYVDEPSGWADPGFDDSAWQAATVWTAADVSPKDGYDEIDWNADADLIWGDDLETVNTVLCRYTISP